MKKRTQKLQGQNKVFNQLWQRLRNYRFLLALIIICALLSNSLFLLIPRLTGQAIDTMISPGEILWSELRRFILFILLTTLGGSILQKLLLNITAKVAAGITADLRLELATHTEKMPLKELDSRESSDITGLLTYDLNMLSEGLVTGMSQAFGGLVTLIGTLLMMIRLHAGITLIVIILTPLSFFISGKIASAARAQYLEESLKNSQLRQLMEESTEQLALLQSYDAKDAYLQKLLITNKQLYTHGQKAQFYSSLTNPVTRLINAGAYILTAAFSAYLAVLGVLSTGNVASLLGYSMQFSRPINEITTVTTQLQAAFAGAQRIFSLLSTELEEPEDPHVTELKVKHGQVLMQDVNFSYYAGQALIKNLNLSIKPASQVALVGPTGAGKTTLLNLLLRFYEVDQGRILIDQQVIKSVSKHSLRAAIGIVLQDSWLFSGTIKENIAFGRPEATSAEIVQVAKDAGAHGFITRLPQGYETSVLTAGERLSAGQKQLISIARTMLSDPQILVLDEATSSVDTYTEKKIQQAFHRLMKGRTSFIIAHRLSTIIDADLILVMKDGTIIEQGTHKELLAADGFYTGLFKAQFADSMP